MALDQWLALSAICLLGAASPGPSLAVVLQSSLAESRNAGIATALGHGCGVAVYAMLTVSGLGFLVSELPGLYSGIKLTGAGYLLWLAASAWRAESPSSAGKTQERQHSSFTRGALVALLNPKLAIFMLALFSQFLDPGAGWPRALILVATAGLIDALWYTGVATAAGTLGVSSALSRHARPMNRAFALLLAALAIWVTADTLLKISA